MKANSEKKERLFLLSRLFNEKKRSDKSRTREDRMDMYSKIFIIRSVHAKYS